MLSATSIAGDSWVHSSDGLLSEMKNVPAGHNEANEYFGNKFGSHLSYRPERANAPGPGIQPPSPDKLIELFEKIRCML